MLNLDATDDLVNFKTIFGRSKTGVDVAGLAQANYRYYSFAGHNSGGDSGTCFVEGTPQIAEFFSGILSLCGTYSSGTGYEGSDYKQVCLFRYVKGWQYRKDQN